MSEMHLKNMVAKGYIQEGPMENNGPSRCKLRNKEQKIWKDWSHTKKR
jgi:hypothetical protein